MRALKHAETTNSYGHAIGPAVAAYQRTYVPGLQARIHVSEVQMKLLRSMFVIAALVAAPAASLAAPILSTSQGTFGTAQDIGGAFTLGADANILDSATIPHAEVQQLGRAAFRYDFYTFFHLGGDVYFDVDSAPTATNFDVGDRHLERRRDPHRGQR